MVKLKQMDLLGADFEQAKRLARAAADAVWEGKLGYALLIGVKSAENIITWVHLPN